MVPMVNRVYCKDVGRIATLVIIILSGAHSKRTVEKVVILWPGVSFVQDACVLNHALQNAKREGQRWQYSTEKGGREPTSAHRLVNIHYTSSAKSSLKGSLERF